MNTNTVSTNTNSIFAAILGIAALALIVLFLTGRQIPLISGDRAAFIALAVIGIAMCALGGIGPATSTYGWTHPITIIGTVLGVVALIIVGTTLFNIRLPLLTDDRAAFIALAAIGFIKVVVAAAQNMLA